MTVTDQTPPNADGGSDRSRPPAPSRLVTIWVPLAVVARYRRSFS